MSVDQSAASQLMRENPLRSICLKRFNHKTIQLLSGSEKINWIELKNGSSKNKIK